MYSPSKRTALVAEQFRFQKLALESGAVQVHENFIGAAAVFMDPFGKDAFS